MSDDRNGAARRTSTQQEASRLLNEQRTLEQSVQKMPMRWAWGPLAEFAQRKNRAFRSPSIVPTWAMTTVLLAGFLLAVLLLLGGAISPQEVDFAGHPLRGLFTYAVALVVFTMLWAGLLGVVVWIVFAVLHVIRRLVSHLRR